MRQAVRVLDGDPADRDVLGLTQVNPGAVLFRDAEGRRRPVGVSPVRIAAGRCPSVAPCSCAPVVPIDLHASMLVARAEAARKQDLRRCYGLRGFASSTRKLGMPSSMG